MPCRAAVKRRQRLWGQGKHWATCGLPGDGRQQATAAAAPTRWATPVAARMCLRGNAFRLTLRLVPYVSMSSAKACVRKRGAHTGVADEVTWKPDHVRVVHAVHAVSTTAHGVTPVPHLRLHEGAWASRSCACELGLQARKRCSCTPCQGSTARSEREATCTPQCRIPCPTASRRAIILIKR